MNTSKIKFGISIFVIMIFPICAVFTFLKDYLPKNIVTDTLSSRNSFIPNSKVFTAENDKYSILLGGKVTVTAIKKNGDELELNLFSRNMFNHFYLKNMSNLLTTSFAIYTDKNEEKHTLKYLAAKQLLCTNDTYENIIIERKLVQNSKIKRVKNFDNIIYCNK